MNEKIENLAEIANGLALTEFNDVSLRKFRLYLEIYNEKFAQLIINECEQLNVMQSYELSGVIIDTENIEFDDICLNTVKRVEKYLSGNSLQEHFGVK